MVMIGTNSFLVIIGCIIVMLIIDTTIREISVFTGGLGTGVGDLAIFLTMVLAYAIGQYLIIQFLLKVVCNIRIYIDW